MNRATRGYGVFENFLSTQRSNIAMSLIRPVETKERILDIGCGTTPVFLSKVDFSDKYGLDKINGRNCGNHIADEIKLIDFDIERNNKLPFADNYFNAVTMLAVIEHIKPGKISEFLTEIYRVLVPGGIYVITTPSFWTGGLLNIMARMGLVSAIEVDEHKFSWKHSQLSLLLHEAGFQKSAIHHGYFEIFANSWSTAVKR
jgi:ubiquinone/menaquinone biosynthesis C-methylase UbiE